MKILVITQYFYPESFRINSLCKELVLRGHDVTVMTGYPNYPQGKFYDGYGWNKPYDTVWEGVKIKRVKIFPRGKASINLLINCLNYVWVGNRWVKKCKEQFDVCYVFEVSPVTVALPALKYKKKFGTPILLNVQDLWPENVEIVLGVKNKLILGYLNKIVNKIYAHSDKILCASNSFKKSISARGVDNNKIVYWPQFCDESPDSIFKTPIEYDANYFKIVFTGNIGEAQGLNEVINAASILDKAIQIKWYIIGDGRAKAQLVSMVKEKNLENSVIFIDRKPESEVYAYIKSADCALISLKANKVFEMTIPAKLQTYLSCGVPILSIADGEVNDIITKSECGYCVSASDYKGLAKLALAMKDISKEKLTLMGSNSRKCYDDNFTKEKLIDELIDMFDDFKQ